jgi:hypothetical protein
MNNFWGEARPALLAALGLLLTAGFAGESAWPAPPALGPFDPMKHLSDEERDARVKAVREGWRTPKEVERLLGPPQRTARQILYPCYLEQWIYEPPSSFHLRIEFRCPHGQEAHVQSVQEFTPGG